jgi:hypothetical protein
MLVPAGIAGSVGAGSGAGRFSCRSFGDASTLGAGAAPRAQQRSRPPRHRRDDRADLHAFGALGDQDRADRAFVDASNSIVALSVSISARYRPI